MRTSQENSLQVSDQQLSRAKLFYVCDFQCSHATLDPEYSARLSYCPSRLMWLPSFFKP